MQKTSNVKSITGEDAANLMAPPPPSERPCLIDSLMRATSDQDSTLLTGELPTFTTRMHKNYPKSHYSPFIQL